MTESVQRLRDGTRVHLRPIEPADRARLAEGFARLSSESRYRRFFVATPRLTDAMLDRLVANDGWNRLAIGAETAPADDTEGEGVGVARFARLPDEPDVAEVAVAVVDDRQGQGLGRLLLTALTDAARERGIRRFRATILRENAPARAMLEDLADAFTVRPEDNALVYDFPLPERGAEAVATGVLGRFLRLAAGGVQFVFRALGAGDEPSKPAS